MTKSQEMLASELNLSIRQTAYLDTLTPLTHLVSCLFTVNNCSLLPTLIKEHLRIGI